jgi:uncharacterized protein YndB with AHSA1/START domain
MDARYGAILKHDDSWEIRFERRLAHPAQAVWDAITGPGRMSLWFDRTEFPVPLEIGGVIRFFHDAVGLESRGRITALDPPRLIEWMWSSNFTPDQLMSWRIEPEGEGCRLILRQRMGDVTLVGRTTAGWHVCLDRMAAVLDGRPAGDHMTGWSPLFEHYKGVLKAMGVSEEQQGAPPKVAT